MVNLTKLSFEFLNQEFGGKTWCDTFAYWIGTVNLLATEKSKLEEISEYMDYWYDMEEQAQDTSWFQDEHEVVPTPFRPIAPITLTNSWSPFPSALTVLGQPLLFTRLAGRVAATFKPKPLAWPKAASDDEVHFFFLLNHACEQAIAANSQVLLTGSPGWNYEGEDFIAQNAKIQQIMQQFGFVFFNRKPIL